MPVSPSHPLAIITQRLDLPESSLEPRGRDVFKVDPAAFASRPLNGRVVLVTAMTPTPSGEGKTTTVIGLLDALCQRNVKAVAALREPSLGPVFGAKGGAVGGGRSQVQPQESINLHFTGDIHAVTSAHNLLAAMVDNHLFHGNTPLLDPKTVTWGRVMDMNDRALRKVTVGVANKGGPPHESRFDITAASEVMAILCLSKDIPDLRARLDRIVVATSVDGAPVTARDLKAGGAMAALLLDACRPNLVRTLEDNPVFIHGGPFGNVAQGTSSLMQTQLCRRLADVVVTEAGFAFDLGGTKFLDLKGRAGDFRPAAVVLVVTVRALRFHGNAPQEHTVDVAAVGRGLANIHAHLDAMERMGLDPPVVAINRFPDDAPEELALVHALSQQRACTVVEANHFAQGGAGALALADAVMAQLKERAQDSPRLVLPSRLDLPVLERVRHVARVVLGAADVEFTPDALAQLAALQAMKLPELPVCLAKTHLSISDRSEIRGHPGAFTLKVTGIRANAGAGFLVVLCGPILTMPGFHAHPAAETVDIAQDVDGRFVAVGLH